MSQHTEGNVENKGRKKSVVRKTTLGDYFHVESKFLKQMDQKSRSGWKNALRKNEIINAKVEKEDVKLKKILRNIVKEEKSQLNFEFLSYNRFSVLENEEVREELDDFGSCDKIQITSKAVAKKNKKYSKGNRKLEKTVESADSNSSEGIYAEVLRCRKCFQTHFPSRKICKLNMPKEEKYLKIANRVLDEENIQLLKIYINYLETHLNKKTLRLRGGAGSEGSQSPLIITRAIESANKHGIHLVEEIFNAADGNCAFDAVINNINYRECFREKLSLHSEVYRQVWVTELENESSKYPTLGAGYTKEEKEENWNRLKQSGVYEIDFFGDLVMHAIARGCNKNILIFNTNVDAADPIYVVEANQFGGFIDTDIPVVVAYNQVYILLTIMT